MGGRPVIIFLFGYPSCSALLPYNLDRGCDRINIQMRFQVLKILGSLTFVEGLLKVGLNLDTQQGNLISIKALKRGLVQYIISYTRPILFYRLSLPMESLF